MTPTAPTERRTRETGAGIGIAEGLVVLAGLYLIMAPWLVSYHGLIQVVLSNIVVGLLLIVLGIAHAAAFHRLRGVSWVIPVLGLWIVLSPLAIFHPGDPRPTSTVWLNNAIGGAIAVLAGVAITIAAARRTA
jgi:hypothetical protein